MPICLIIPDVSPMILWESSQKVGGGGEEEGGKPQLTSLREKIKPTEKFKYRR